jgi:hypothetical protein
MQKSHLFGAACILLVLECAPVAAAILDYQIQGTVTSVASPLLGPVSVGNIVTGTFQVDTTAHTVPAWGDTYASYTASNLVLNVGAAYTVTGGSGSGYLTVYNNYAGSSFDGVELDFTSALGMSGPTINSSYDPDELECLAAEYRPEPDDSLFPVWAAFQWR